MPSLLLSTYEYPPVGGGMGKAARAMARALMRRGYDVTVLTARFGDQERDARDPGEPRVLRLPVLRRHRNRASALEVLSFAASGVLLLPWWARRCRPDATVCFLTIPSGIVAEAHRLIGGPRWVALLRGQDVPGFPDTPRWMHTVAWPLTWYLWRRAARVVANSQGLADLAHRSAPRLPIRIVPNGIDVERYRPRARPRKGGPVRVLFAGRLVRFKGLRNLVAAWEHVSARATDPVELWIAGYGPERPVLEALVDRAGLTTVRFLGPLAEERLIRALQAADVFVNPSEGEGMPNAVLEAMACGLPVVLSDIGPHREMLLDGRGGVLCDAASPHDMARALAPLVADAGLRRRLGAEAREVVRDHFSWDQAVGRLIPLLPDRR